MDALTIRPATHADIDRIEAIVNDPPSDELVALVSGDVARARRFARSMVQLGLALDVAYCVVAELDGEIVGVMEAGVDVPERSMSLRAVTRGLASACRIFGVAGALRLLPKLPAMARVQPARVRGSYYISELDVDPAYRNRGIGGELLRHAEQSARAAGTRSMTLNTTITNPARRLYERCGYTVIETLTDPRYEELTGIPGRVLMMKDLA